MNTIKYITILTQAWINERGCGFIYNWDGLLFSTRKEAISNGFSRRQSDDFNVGVVEDGRLISVDWMDEVVDDDPDILADIASQIEFKGP